MFRQTCICGVPLVALLKVSHHVNSPPFISSSMIHNKVAHLKVSQPIDEESVHIKASTGRSTLYEIGIRNREYTGVEIDHGRGPPQARPAWRARFRGSGRPDFEPIGALSPVVGGVPGRRLAASGWTKRSYRVLSDPSSHCRASRNPRRGNSCQLSHGRGLRRHALAFLSRAGVLLFPCPAPDRS